MVEPASIVPLARFKAERLLAVGGVFTTIQNGPSPSPVPLESAALTSARDSFFCLVPPRLQIPSSFRRHFPAAKIVSLQKATMALNCRVSRAHSSCAFSKSACQPSCSERSTGTSNQPTVLALALRVCLKLFSVGLFCSPTHRSVLCALRFSFRPSCHPLLSQIPSQLFYEVTRLAMRRVSWGVRLRRTCLTLCCPWCLRCPLLSLFLFVRVFC